MSVSKRRLSASDLKAICKDKGLSQEGTMVALQARLREHDEALATSEKETAPATDLPLLPAQLLPTSCLSAAAERKELEAQLELLSKQCDAIRTSLSKKNPELENRHDAAPKHPRYEVLTDTDEEEGCPRRGRTAYHVYPTKLRVWIRALKIIDADFPNLDPMVLTWSSDKIFITPRLWPLMFRHEPVEETRIYNKTGIQGDFLLYAQRKLMKFVFLRPTDVISLLEGLEVVYVSVKPLPPSPDMSDIVQYYDRNHSILNPLIHLCLDAAVRAGEDACLPLLVTALRQQQRMDMHSVPQDRVDFAQRIMKSRAPTIVDQIDRPPRHNQPPRKGFCRACQTPIPKGRIPRDWFKEHNKICKGK